MATTIRSADLDFNQIKNELKTYFVEGGEFSDYNFEASGLSNLLDVLAYNTHQNALLANFALNESFLSTAQLRSSIVGLAGSLGYTVGSRAASVAVVNLSVYDPSGISTKTIPAGFSFSTTVNNKSYTFRTREALTATNDEGTFNFTLNGSVNIPIYEGTAKSKNFIAGITGETDTYIIPVSNLDLESVRVRVYENTSTSIYDLYLNINDVTNITGDSRIFVIKETPNGFYEVSFGNGVVTNQVPSAGNRIQIIYDTVVGPEANGAYQFEPNNQLGGFDVGAITVARSSAGSLKEEIESVRKNAPYLYAAQNRMVTAEDYSALILRNFPNQISDIKSWGGEDNIPPRYGSVFISIDFETDNATVQEATKGNITNLAKDLSVASFDIEFVEPNRTFLEVETVFQFNPYLTSSSQTAIETSVGQTMKNYFDTNLGKFDQSFRRSNMLTEIDETDPSVLSSRATVRMQNRFTPQSGVDSYTIAFPSSIATEEEDAYTVKSTNFYFNGKVCFLRNRIDTTIIEVIDTSTGKSEVDNVGNFYPSEGTIVLSGFTGSLISGTYFKINALPANQATINPQRNNILIYDDEASTASAIITDTL
jgi:hypothetical protein